MSGSVTIPTVFQSLRGTSGRVATLQCLPDDLILLLMKFMDINGMLALRQTCKRLFVLSKIRWVWTDAFQRFVCDQRLPFPGKHTEIKALSSRQLELRVGRAARFHHNWLSRTPRARNSIVFQDRHHEHPVQVNVHFLAGRDGELLITMTEDKDIICWEVPLHGSHALRIAEMNEESWSFHHLVCNDDPDSPAAICVVLHKGGNETLRVYELDKFHGRFVQLSPDRPVTPVMGPILMHGDLILTNTLHVYDWRKDRMLKLMRPPDDHQDLETEILCAKYINGYFLIIKEESAMMVKAPDSGEITTSIGRSETLAYRIAQWGFTAYEATIYLQDRMYHDKQSKWPTTPVTVLLRHADEGLVTQWDFMPKNVPAAFDKVATDGDTSNRAPVSAPVQFYHRTSLFPVVPSQMTMVIGPSGKGVWMEMRNVTRNHWTYPARCIIGLHIRSLNPRPSESGHLPAQPDVSVYQCKTELHVQRLGPCASARQIYSHASIALEDTVGRIAIAGHDGNIEVLDFA